MEHKLAPNQLLLTGKRIFLSPVTLDDCTEQYRAWLANAEINRYLETRWSIQSLESIKDFVSAMLADPNSYLFAIRLAETEQHIGNIKLGPINSNHRYGDVSYFIGERAAWGQGFATEAIQLVTQFGFNTLKLHRLQAGIYANNKGSGRALEKAGYHLEATFKNQLRSDCCWEDHLWYAIFNKDEL